MRRAGVTRGALYHHFPDKAALLEAVVEAVAAEIRDAVLAATVGSGSARDALVDGARAYLDACLRRRGALDLPGRRAGGAGLAALARDRRRPQRPAAARGVEAALAGSAGGDRDPAALTTLLSGALNEAALWLADAPDDAPGDGRRRAALDATLADLFARLFPEAPG